MVHRIDDYKRKEKSTMLPYIQGGRKFHRKPLHCHTRHVLFHAEYRRAISKNKWFFVNSRMCVCISREDTHIIQCNAGLQYYTWYQVWPLTQFYSVSFSCKIIDLPGGQINDPLSGKNFLSSASQQLPCLCLRPLKGFLSSHSAH